MTYYEYVFEKIRAIPNTEPIYTAELSEKVAETFHIEIQNAKLIVANAVHRIVKRNILPELKCYKKGVYYKTETTIFGKLGINKERVIYHDYIANDNGYDTDGMLLYEMHLTTYIPNKRIIKTNNAKRTMYHSKDLDVFICPSNILITPENICYLKTLDCLKKIDSCYVNAENPYEIICNYINQNDLKYDYLMALADVYYSKEVMKQLIVTVKEGRNFR